MRRRFFTILSVVSLLMGTATCALWVRSYFSSDWFAYGWPRPDLPGYAIIQIISSRGNVLVEPTWMADSPGGPRYHSDQPRQPWTHIRDSAVDINPHGETFQRWHVQRSTDPLGAHGGWDLWLRDWQILLLTAAFPAIWAVRAICRRRRLRTPAGRCRHCGYDLRATPDRCPECGIVPEKANLISN